jgi:cation:H+ antiporter
VLSALTSWPEFKSCLSLFRRRRPLAAVLNITVSNVTNIWLAVLGVAVYLLMSTL